MGKLARRCEPSGFAETICDADRGSRCAQPLANDCEPPGSLAGTVDDRWCSIRVRHDEPARCV